MTTIINNPGTGDDSGGMAGMIVGIVLLVVVVTLFFVYALPAMRNSGTPNPSGANINVTLPANNGTTAK